jgi:hypothetical protein
MWNNNVFFTLEQIVTPEYYYICCLPSSGIAIACAPNTFDQEQEKLMMIQAPPSNLPQAE